MIFQISHQIQYAFNTPVFLEPHIVRLHPRNDPCQTVTEYSMSVDPEPTGKHSYIDIEGNHATCLWFENKTDSLTVATTFEVKTICMNPFGYLVTDDSFFQLPVQYNEQYSLALAPFLSSIYTSDTVQQFAQNIIQKAENRTLDFLSLLCSQIYENFTVMIRHKGHPQPPDVTLQQKEGACRDLALLFVTVCREVGLASRFVSGYQEGDPDMEYPHLHAWAEVYIPGGGWRGYDPTHGLVVADRHVVIAASHKPEGASPIKGSFRGTGVKADMEYTISIKTFP